MCAWASEIMKFHSCCKRWWQGTQQPGLSCSQIKAEPTPRWKKYPDEMLLKEQVVGSWPKVIGPAYPVESLFPPTQRAGQGIVQVLPEPSVYPHTARQAPAQGDADTCAPPALVPLAVLHALLTPDSTCFGPSSHNLRLVLFWTSPAQPRRMAIWDRSTAVNPQTCEWAWPSPEQPSWAPPKWPTLRLWAKWMLIVLSNWAWAYLLHSIIVQISNWYCPRLFYELIFWI